jgi:hypothetical protein
MFRQILFTHIRWTRGIVASMAFFAFVLPAAAWMIGSTSVLDPENPRAIMAGFQNVGISLVIVAILGGFLLAAYPWTMEAQTKHVYPLSLPIPWRSYVTMRFSAGALTLLIPAIALLAGSIAVLSMLDIGDSLRAYPGTLTIRFLTASLLTYSITFALQYTFGRRAPAVVLGGLGAIAVLSFVLGLTGNSTLMDRAFQWLVEAPGPLAVFASDWTLVDV